MGSVVKHVTGALTGHSGGGKTETKQNSTQSQSQQSWLESNPQYQALQNNALNEANNFNMPGYQLAGQNQNINEALAKLGKGVDTTQYKDAYSQMLSQGQASYSAGNTTVNSAMNTLNKLGNMTQTDYQNMMKSEYNDSLVQEQIKGLQSDVTDQYNQQVHTLNQRATAEGNMGSSRAGVAQGVMAGQAQKAIASGSTQYRVAEESQAYQRLNSYLGLQSSTAGQMASIGQNQVSQGLQMYGAGMGYYSQYNQAQTQNAQNQFQAGQYQRQLQQQQLDVNRQNEILRSSPALQRLAMYNGQFLNMANLSTSGTGTFSGTGTNTTPGSGANLLGGLMGTMGSMFGGSFGGANAGQYSQMGSMIGGAFGNSYGG